MITQKSPPAMIPVAQPSRRLASNDWNALEMKLFAAMSSKATARQAAQAKRVAL